jgi:hypothetical protein
VFRYNRTTYYGLLHQLRNHTAFLGFPAIGILVFKILDALSMVEMEEFWQTHPPKKDAKIFFLQGSVIPLP